MMAGVNSSSKTVVVVVVVLAFVSGSLADLIADICSETQKKPLCEQILRGARSRSPDLFSLGQVAVSAAIKATSDNVLLLQKLYDREVTREAKEALAMCFSDMKASADHLLDCSVALYGRRYPDMLKDASLSNNVGELVCDKRFTGSIAILEPIILRDANRRVDAIVSIVLAIAQALNKHYY